MLNKRANPAYFYVWIMTNQATEKPWRKAPDSRIDMTRLPRHIAIIMDGNGRWAEQRGKRHVEGHEAGAKAVRQTIEACRELGVEMLSIYAFSTENWQRSKQEVDALFRLMSRYIHKEIEDIDRQHICVKMMGDMDKLPAKAAKDMQYCMERTAKNTAMTINVALNYGGRNEIINAAKRFAQDVAKGLKSPDDLSEETFASYLYVPESAEVDLMVRTSGELRLSNFMLWQLSYAEIVVSDVLWPDFARKDLFDAVAEFQQRKRRFGGRDNAK